ncbi:MAG: hypothetical protein DI568_02255 [Sphingomonas sp.]|nr:MAG: hypothetical protein DI568_02255 [Sphingomonas sp.]
MSQPVSGGRLLPICLMVSGLLAAPAAAQVGVVPVRPLPQTGVEQWVPVKTTRTGCFDTANIAGAIVVDARTVDVTMKGGKRWRLTLAQQCPQLSYYGGFYYQPRVPGKFCAGSDKVMSRAGGACRVSTISEMKPIRRR